MFVRFRLKLINPENYSGKTSISGIVPSHIRKFKYFSANNVYGLILRTKLFTKINRIRNRLFIVKDGKCWTPPSVSALL